MIKKILITGAKGFLARNLSKFLSKNNYHIYGIGHGKWKSNQYKKYGYKKFISGSIAKKNLSNISTNLDYVIHCAGKSIGYEPLRDFNKNSFSTYILMDYLSKLQKKPKFFFISSIAVGVNNKRKKIYEENKLEPFSHYGLNKKISEDICIFYAKKFKLNMTILRISSLFGEGLNKQFIHDAIVKTLNSQSIFWGTGKEIRDFIHVEDMCVIILKLLKKNINGLNIFNCGAGNIYSTKNIINIIQSLIGKKYSVSFNNYGIIRNPKYLIPSLNKLNKKVKFKSKRDFIQDIYEEIKWIKKKK